MVKVRGYALADPTVVGLLEPFLVVSWAGTDQDEAPSFAVDYLWPDGVDVDNTPDRSNVYVFLLDSRGRVVHTFDPRPLESRGHWDDTYAPHFASELEKGIARLPAEEVRADARRPGEEEREDGLSVRIFSAIEPEATAAFNQPIVETRSLGAGEWDQLSYPRAERRVDASVLEPCLARIYPPGIVFPKESDHASRLVKNGEHRHLTLVPAGTRGGQRHAVLTGTVELKIPGGGREPSIGNVEIVLAYDARSSAVRSMRGVFRGWYVGLGGDSIPFDAVLETVDDWEWR